MLANGQLVMQATLMLYKPIHHKLRGHSELQGLDKIIA